MKIEYINDEQKNGINYDYTLIKKEFKKLKIPTDVYNPLHLPLDKAKWFLTLSERSRGKTTNILLLGMIFNKLYGTEIQYLRTREDMITRKNSKDLFTTIIEYGYIQKLTDNRYNTVIYDARRWFYALIDDDGEIVERSSRQFCTMLSIDKAETYKSVYNAPLGDFIIFDEFIERNYYPTMFLMLMDLIKTIARDRFSVSMFLLANSINKESVIFNDFNIRDDIEDLQKGDYKLVTTDKGTKIYVEIVGLREVKANKRQQKLNNLYYGFNNNKLSAITGAETWAVDSYPHTPQNFKIIQRNHYIDFNNKLVNLEICESLDYNTIFINCHYASRIYDDSVIYTLTDTLDKRYRYKKGYTKIDKYIWDKYDKNLFTYSDNSVGDVVEKFLQLC